MTDRIRSKDLLGRHVVERTTGRRLGRVCAVDYQPGEKYLRALVVETASGCLLLTGGDVFSLGTDENGACLCALQRLKEDVDLAQADFTSAWLELRLGSTPAEVLAGTEWA